MTVAKFRLNVRRAARADIIEQARYYRESASPTVAERWREAADAAMKSLQLLPERGTPIDFQAGKQIVIRRLPIEGFPKHAIFYCVLVEEARIIIVRMLHGARDIETILEVDGSEE